MPCIILARDTNLFCFLVPHVCECRYVQCDEFSRQRCREINFYLVGRSDLKAGASDRSTCLCRPKNLTVVIKELYVSCSVRSVAKKFNSLGNGNFLLLFWTQFYDPRIWENVGEMERHPRCIDCQVYGDGSVEYLLV
jgi:hypothetical protein